MYDYVIVGAGSAGAVIAARLTEDPDVTVALLEAGAPDTTQEIHIPAAFGSLFKSEWGWDLATEPEPELGGRRAYLPRGKMHVFGLTCGLNASVQAGSCLTLIARFDGAKALEVIQRDGVTVFEGVPTMYGALLAANAEAPADLATIRTCICGGAPLPVELLRQFEATFGCVILEGYGLSESAPVACFNHPHLVRKPGTVGVAVKDVALRIVDVEGYDVAAGDVGEILIKGPNVMRGYWGLPEVTEQTVVDGWLHTGDLAVPDDEGYVTIVDRKKDLIIRGGYNVYPREIEEVVYEHPAVAEAAVVGIPHAELGQDIAAAVSFHAGATATEDEIIAFVKERVAAYKYPRHVWIMDALPKGPTGKILRREVREPAVVRAD